MLSNTCKYAARALIYLGKNATEKDKVGIKKIASDLGIPTPFLGKILQNLVRQKVLISTKGPNGGFALGKKAKDISLYDIVTIVDGEDYFKHCLISHEPCISIHAKGKHCPVHGRFSEIRAQLIDFYKETNIQVILDDMKGHEDIITL